MKIAFLKRDPCFFGWLIRLWTRSPYSHCEVVLEDGFMASAMMDQGVRMTHETQVRLHEFWDTVEVPCTALETELVRKWIYSEIGCGYDWLGLFLCQALPIGRQHKAKWFCSEFCTAALQQIGMLGKTKPYTLSPGKLFNALKKELPRA